MSMIIEAQRMQSIEVVIDPVAVIEKLRERFQDTLLSVGIEYDDYSKQERDEYRLFNKVLEVINKYELDY